MLFDRKAYIKVIDTEGTVLEIKNVRVGFSVTRSLSSSSDTSKVTVYNLSRGSRSFLQKKGNTIELFAGYGSYDVIGLLSQGRISSVTESAKEGDVVSEVEFLDTVSSIKDQVVSVTYKEGTKYITVLKNALALSNVPYSFHAEVPTGTYGTGFSFVGPVKKLLDKVCGREGLVWSVQKGRINILKEGEGTKRSIVLLNRNSGMVGTPHKQNNESFLGGSGYSIGALLMPNILPGDKVKIESLEITSEFSVQQIAHTGDTHDTPWNTELQVK